MKGLDKAHTKLKFWKPKRRFSPEIHNTPYLDMELTRDMKLNKQNIKKQRLNEIFETNKSTVLEPVVRVNRKNK